MKSSKLTSMSQKVVAVTLIVVVLKEHRPIRKKGSRRLRKEKKLTINVFLEKKKVFHLQIGCRILLHAERRRLFASKTIRALRRQSVYLFNSFSRNKYCFLFETSFICAGWMRKKKHRRRRREVMTPLRLSENRTSLYFHRFPMPFKVPV